MAGKKGRRDFGALRTLPSGRIQASYVGPDGQRHTAPTTYEDKDAAVVWLKNRRREIENDDWQPARPDVQPMTLRQYAETWLEQRRKANGEPLAPRTRAQYQSLLDGLILPEIGDEPLKRIRPETIDSWHASLDTGPTRKANAYGLLHTIFATAVEQHRATGVTSNPCAIRGAGRSPRASRTEPATLEELATIVDTVSERYEAMVLLAAWCALRFGELIGLRRRDIDASNGVVHVRRGVNLVDGEWVVTGPKAGSLRDVAIPPHVLPAVKDHLRDHVGKSAAALLFPPRNGDGFMRESTLARVYYPAREAAGRPDLRFHDLRHTGLTYAGRAGATLAELMQRAGHKTPQAVMIYQHAAAERDAEIARKLSKMAKPKASKRRRS